MGCIYDYKGHIFQSELELDDFLLERRHLVSKYGDIVFAKSNRAIQTYDSIMNLKMDTEALKANKTISETEDGKNDIENINVSGNGYIGVNKFLQGLRNLDGGLLFPEFRPENYWKEIRQRWAGGNFDKEEAAAIFGEGAETRPIVSDEEFARAREVIENKWKTQGKIGTELHKAMQKYFSESKSGRNIRESDDNFLINTYFPSILDTNLVPSKVIAEIVKYCRDLEKSLQRELGEDLIYLPEVAVSGMTQQLDEEGNAKTMIGVIDLLVIDKNGNVHIVDYKTSPRPYYGTSSEPGYDSAKILTFKYQLAVYERLLKKYGINTSASKLFIAPIKLVDFKKEGDDWVYSGIQEYSGHVEDLTQDIKTNINIQENVDEFLPAPFVTKADTENLLQTVTSTMAKWFPKYNSSPEEITDDMVSDLLKEAGADKPNEETGKWAYSPKYGRWKISTDSYEELFTKVKRKLVSIANNKINITQTIKNGLKEAIEDENPYYEFTKESMPEDPKGVTGWFRSRMARYCNRNWEVVECEPAEYLGCILVRNKESNQIDVIKITTSIPDRRLELVKGRHKLTSVFEDDRTAMKKPNSLMAENFTGNVELMEAMLVLNNISQLFEENAIVGEVAVYNPLFGGKGLSMPNEQLLYCFNELDNFQSVGENKFKSGKIKLGKHYDIFYKKFKEIISRMPSDKNIKGKFNRFVESVSALDALYNKPIELRAELLKLRDDFREAFPSVDNLSKYNPIDAPAIELFRMLEYAIGELDGIDFTQIVKDGNNSIANILSNLRLDNPGNLNNSMLNRLTSLVTTAYQNVRDTNIRYLGDIRTLVNNLKSEQGFSYIKERTLGNQTNLYRDMLIFSDEGDILLKNPDNPTAGLSNAQRDFLRFFLNTVNHNRYKGVTEEELEEWRVSGDDRYYRLPLTSGNFSSIASHKGLLAAVKDKFQDLNPKRIKSRIMAKVEGFLDPEDEKYKSASAGELWEMTNTFDAGEREDIRRKIIEDKGTEFFEYNLETLLLKHITAYSMKENLDSVFPTLQAIAVHISNSGMTQNTEYTKEMEYLLDYIKNKIFNISLVDDNYKEVHAIAQNLMSAASKLALAFNPHQYYQMIDGLWKDISLVIRKPDGSTSFTKENMKNSFKFVAKDMLHFGNKSTLCEWINMLYGINDMDMNTYANKIKSDQVGIWNFWSLAFRCASRPDFYNRMAIFGAQMRGDGCWDAHSVVNGKLVYDWKKDKRFEAYANGRTTDPKYKEQESLYYAMAQQMVKEHTRNADGSVFKIGDTLPKAYTVQQAEGHKALADSIYGYYAHEKKALIQSSFLGSLLMQMNTFWSSKKNQFLAPEGIKLQGRYVQLERDGKKWYHKLDENGNITQEPTDEDTGFPFYVWEGRWEEGIFFTCSHVIKGLYQKGIKEGNMREGINFVVNDIWNNDDPQLRRLYRSNLGQLLYDLLMLLFVGGLGVGALSQFVKDDIKERGNDTATDALVNTGMNMSVRMLKASTDDFNFINSIFLNRCMNWTPFALQTLNRTVNTFSNVVSEDKSLYDGLINSVAATRSTKPFWDYIDPTKKE